jgi:hypothetical protein
MRHSFRPQARSFEWSISSAHRKTGKNISTFSETALTPPFHAAAKSFTVASPSAVQRMAAISVATEVRAPSPLKNAKPRVSKTNTVTESPAVYAGVTSRFFQ